MSFTTSALILTWVVLALFGLALSGVMRQLAQLRNSRGAASPVSDPIVGERLELPPGLTRRAHAPLMMFVASSTCGSCRSVLPEFVASAHRLGPLVQAVVVLNTALDDLPVEDLTVLADQSRYIESLRLPALPYALFLDADDRVVKATPVGSQSRLLEFETGLAESAPTGSTA